MIDLFRGEENRDSAHDVPLYSGILLLLEHWHLAHIGGRALSLAPSGSDD
jgi:hypothetical protein